MTVERFRFGRFTFEPQERRLCEAGADVTLSGRYLDALALLVREHGRLVTKAQLFDEVWRGVPVTDDALTQCVRTLRRVLGDDAARPQFIETVTGHGYRFIASVERSDDAGRPQPTRPSAEKWPQIWGLARAAALGGGVAGAVGGFAYGVVLASPGSQTMGAVSALIVLTCLTALVGLAGALAVGLGIGLARALAQREGWVVAGGALGGLLIGAAVKRIGLDAFTLLLGRSPGDITGAAEGALLGAAVGLAVWLSARLTPAVAPRRAAALGALTGGLAGGLATAFGGRLMGGSLALVAERFPESRMPLESLGAMVGEAGFGPVAQAVTAGLEGALFVAGVTGAMALAARGSTLSETAS